METTQITEQDARLVGNLWERGTKRRVYIDVTPQEIGLQVTRYNTGNVSGARLDGEGISNTYAKDILSSMSKTSVYWDAADGMVHAQTRGDRVREEWVISSMRDAAQRMIARARDAR